MPRDHSLTSIAGFPSTGDDTPEPEKSQVQPLISARLGADHQVAVAAVIARASIVVSPVTSPILDRTSHTPDKPSTRRRWSTPSRSRCAPADPAVAPPARGSRENWHREVPRRINGAEI
jgi:hypothetical protein